MKQKASGNIPNTWEYFDDVELLSFKDSAEAYNVFSESVGCDGVVILGFFNVNHPQYDDVLVWIFIFTDEESKLNGLKENPDEVTGINFKMALSPVFKKDAELIPLISSPEFDFAGDFIMVREDGLYEPIITSTSEIAIRRIRSVLSEEKAVAIMEAQGMEVKDIYPVELYSPFTKGPICTCWSIVFKDTPESVQWIPVSYEDVNKLEGYEPSDLHEFPVNLDSKVSIGDSKFVLKYEKEKGKFFQLSEFDATFVPDKNTPNIIHFIPKKSKYLS